MSSSSIAASAAASTSFTADIDDVCDRDTEDVTDIGSGISMESDTEAGKGCGAVARAAAGGSDDGSGCEEEEEEEEEDVKEEWVR